jgi:hypothetical protein
MDIVTLPLVADVESLDVAIERMNEAKRRMIVVASSTGGFRVHRALTVLQGWRTRHVAIGELQGGDRVISLRGTGDFAGDVPSPGRYAELEKMLDDAGQALFALAAMPEPGARFAVILTRHEGITGDARSTTRECVCLVNSGHNGTDPPPVPVPGSCPYCGGAWRCA